MERIQEFTKEGKHFIYFDISDFTEYDAFVETIETAKETISKYPEHSVYTITNITSVWFDSDSKKVVVDWLQHNKTYVKEAVIIGLDGMKKIMLNSVFALSNRKNISFANTKEEAVEMLLKK